MVRKFFGSLLERAGRALKASEDDIGWLQRVPGMPFVQDGTGKFDNLLFNIKNYNQHTLPKSLAYLLVPGLFSNFGPPSFADTQAYFQRLGLDCEIAKIDSEAGVITNAKKIKKCIKTLYNRSRKKVVILGHSKGGLDAAAALSIYWHKLEDKVAGLVLAQCPYAGNPIASDILRQGSFQRVNLKREVMELVMSGILKGDLRAIEDLTYKKRREFLEENPLPKQLPVVSFHTQTKINHHTLKKFYEVAKVEFSSNTTSNDSNASELWSISSGLAVLATVLQLRYGVKSDGLVTREDAEAPGSIVVRYGRNLDHCWIVGNCSNDVQDSGKANNSQVCEALFALVIEMAQMKGFINLRSR
ncbi:GPI inositol-deacylase PGAP1-like protein [Dioscorea alata]|uniref:GPI inositol-deacylase PGAP1-like protein n=1 Tax=Dioscorea alata TaxID=55571 RepID=A0ACB7WIR3_DIOAL|nr:GPI inositol-deacylase PGAP1-like protein [Dioscorea alata]